MSDELLGKPWAQAPMDLVTADISHVAFRLLMAIQLHRRPEGKAPFPGQARLAAMLRVSRPTVERAVRELQEKGFLVVTKRVRPDGSRGTNSYRMTMPKSAPGVGGLAITGDGGDAITGDGTEVEEVGSRKIVSDGEQALAPVMASTDGPSGALAERAPSGTLVAYFVDESTRLSGVAPPRGVIGMVAKRVGELVGEGVPALRVQAGIDLLLQRRLHPSTLPSLVHEASLPAVPRAKPGFVSPADVLASADRLRQMGR